jgi:hypothetical protein
VREKTKKSLQKSSREAIGKQDGFYYLCPNEERKAGKVDFKAREKKLTCCVFLTIRTVYRKEAEDQYFFLVE